MRQISSPTDWPTSEPNGDSDIAAERGGICALQRYEMNGQRLTARKGNRPVFISPTTPHGGNSGSSSHSRRTVPQRCDAGASWQANHHHRAVSASGLKSCGFIPKSDFDEFNSTGDQADM